jgi:hypothetical protein
MLRRHYSLHRVQGVLSMRCVFSTFHADPKYHNTSMPPAMSDRRALKAYKYPVFASILPYLFIHTWFLFFKVWFPCVHARRGVALFSKGIRRPSVRIFCLTRLCGHMKCSKSQRHRIHVCLVRYRNSIEPHRRLFRFVCLLYPHPTFVLQRQWSTWAYCACYCLFRNTTSYAWWEALFPIPPSIHIDNEYQESKLLFDVCSAHALNGYKNPSSSLLCLASLFSLSSRVSQKVAAVQIWSEWRCAFLHNHCHRHGRSVWKPNDKWIMPRWCCVCLQHWHTKVTMDCRIALLSKLVVKTSYFGRDVVLCLSQEAKTLLPCSWPSWMFHIRAICTYVS